MREDNLKWLTLARNSNLSWAYLSGTPFRWCAPLTLPQNTWLESFPGTNTLVYYAPNSVMQTVLKFWLQLLSIYNIFSQTGQNTLECFIWRLFKPSLLFTTKAEDYPQMKDKARKLIGNRHSKHLLSVTKMSKSFIILTPNVKLIKLSSSDEKA